MRHGKKINHLSRTAEHRAALLSNMATSLIMHKRINTTVAKAKALRRYVEPLITKAKDNTTHSRRVVFSYLQNKDAVKELFGDVAGKIADRPGGYTRIFKTGNRLGDNAEMALIELVDYNEYITTSKGDKKAGKTRRSRRGTGKTKADAETTAAPKAKAKPVAEEKPAEVETPVENTEATNEPEETKE